MTPLEALIESETAELHREVRNWLAWKLVGIARRIRQDLLTAEECPVNEEVLRQLLDKMGLEKDLYEEVLSSFPILEQTERFLKTPARERIVQKALAEAREVKKPKRIIRRG